jgi:hypothetical protein
MHFVSFHFISLGFVSFRLVSFRLISFAVCYCFSDFCFGGQKNERKSAPRMLWGRRSRCRSRRFLRLARATWQHRLTIRSIGMI